MGGNVITMVMRFSNAFSEAEGPNLNGFQIAVDLGQHPKEQGKHVIYFGKPGSTNIAGAIHVVSEDYFQQMKKSMDGNGGVHPSTGTVLLRPELMSPGGEGYYKVQVAKGVWTSLDKERDNGAFSAAYPSMYAVHDAGGPSGQNVNGLKALSTQTLQDALFSLSDNLPRRVDEAFARDMDSLSRRVTAIDRIPAYRQDLNSVIRASDVFDHRWKTSFGKILESAEASLSFSSGSSDIKP